MIKIIIQLIWLKKSWLSFGGKGFSVFLPYKIKKVTLIKKQGAPLLLKHCEITTCLTNNTKSQKMLLKVMHSIRIEKKIPIYLRL